MNSPDNRAPFIDSLLPRVLRATYWFGWFFVLPLTLARLLIVLLTPDAGALEGIGVLAPIQWMVQEQPLPVGIVAVALFDFVIWSVRHHLPLTRFAFPPYVIDLRPGVRASFERARGLLDESDRILTRHKKVIAQDLTASEREELESSIAALRAVMLREPFEEGPFIDALIRADGEVDVRLARWRRGETREYIESILIAVAIALLLRAFVIEAFKIPSGSMIPTLQVGDHIFVNKFIYGPTIPGTKTRILPRMPPHRGDVIVFCVS